MASSADPVQLSSDFISDPIDSFPVDPPTIYIIVPVASIGCGKTTIGKSLSRLFGWPIIQNDDIPLDSIDRKQLYIDTILNALKRQYVSRRDNTSPLVVFAERNNHLHRERSQLIHDINSVLLKFTPNIKYICLFFDHSNVDRLNSITSRRVIGRGDNHKTVQKSIMGEKAIYEMMNGFQNRFESVEGIHGLGYDFDSIINLFVSHDNSSRSNLNIITFELAKRYPDLVPFVPTEDDLDRVFMETIIEFQVTKALLEG